MSTHDARSAARPRQVVARVRAALDALEHLVGGMGSQAHQPSGPLAQPWPAVSDGGHDECRQNGPEIGAGQHPENLCGAEHVGKRKRRIPRPFPDRT